jgi:hypothetical protein
MAETFRGHRFEDAMSDAEKEAIDVPRTEAEAKHAQRVAEKMKKEQDEKFDRGALAFSRAVGMEAAYQQTIDLLQDNPTAIDALHRDLALYASHAEDFEKVEKIGNPTGSYNVNASESSGFAAVVFTVLDKSRKEAGVPLLEIPEDDEDLANKIKQFRDNPDHKIFNISKALKDGERKISPADEL